MSERVRGGESESGGGHLRGMRAGINLRELYGPV